MLEDKDGLPLDSARIQQIRRRITTHPSAVESQQSCKARRHVPNNFVGSRGGDVCQYCGVGRLLHEA